MKGRSIGAVFAGIVVIFVVSYLFNKVIDQLYPPDFDTMREIAGDRQKMIEYFKNLPAGFHFMGILGGVIRLIVALFVGSAIDKQNLMTSIVISAFALLLAILDSFAFPHPIWYGLAYVPAIVLVSMGYIYLKRRA